MADRASRAREALRHAELRTGARSMPASVPAGPVGAAPVPALPAQPSSPSSASASLSPPLSSASPSPTSSHRHGRAGHPDRPPLPVPTPLAHLLPEGALHRGGTLVVQGSTSLVLALVSTATQEGAWVAVVGQPGVGVLAAQQAGVVLERLALVPRPGPDAPTVVAALLDGVDLVVVGSEAALLDSDRRRLMARARERGAVLLPTTSWQGAHLVLTAEPAGSTGLGAGHGHLRSHRWTVTRGGRGSAGRPVRTEVVLPVRATPPSRHVPATPLEPVRSAEHEAAPLRLVG
ncbi:hypothetical protein [Cellulomonas fimi]|uniref:Uncharacterized protein n=1 Tax=Cellulomonas fimi TaxID=1708 RepID=A0A7Y0QIX0_CELFI|nr:hypothetical protein [Cellulomonas fimi]NMR20747.1 hypothetical protein [Cellulomonas fimi]